MAYLVVVLVTCGDGDGGDQDDGDEDVPDGCHVLRKSEQEHTISQVTFKPSQSTIVQIAVPT